MSNSGRPPREREEPHLLVEGLRGVLVLTLTTAGVSVAGWIVAAAFAAMFV
jgi:hypothetical protein